MSEHASRAYRQVHLSRTESLSSRNVQVRLVLVALSLPALLFLVSSTLDSLLVASAEAVGSVLLASAFVASPKGDVAATVVLSGGHVPAAIRAVESEKEHVEAERETFAEFAEEIQTLSTANRSMIGATTQTVNSTPGNHVLKRVREQYRETVMSTADFDAEYGESFRQHVAAEFGDDMAAILADGHHLNGPVKRLVVQQAKQSAKQRELLLEGLTIEERSLEEADRTLEPTRRFLRDTHRTDLFEQSLPELIALDEELQAHRERCHRLVQKRQTDVHTVNRRMQGESKTLTQEYLYADLDVNFPVLSTTLQYLDALAEVRSELVQAISWAN